LVLFILACHNWDGCCNVENVGLMSNFM
jgi:hypothetical protein